MKSQRCIYLPMLGAFSSGKSSLLNSIFGERLLSTDITPETAVPAEIRGGDTLELRQVLPEGRSLAISRSVFDESDFSELAAQGGYISLIVPSFSQWPNLVAVDLPGWSSGESDHEKQLDTYLDKLLTDKLDTDIVYVIVVGADEGTLRSYTADRLKAVVLGNSDYVLVITKTEKRMPEDLLGISKHLEENITKLMGKKPIDVIFTSARKNMYDEFFTFLNSTQERTIDKKQILVEQRSKVIEQLCVLKEALVGDLENDPSDIGEFTGSDLSCIYSDLLDSAFDYQRYSSTAFNWFLDDIKDKYIDFYTKNFNRWVNEPSEELKRDLVELGLTCEGLLRIEPKADSFTRAIKSSLRKKFESAKPGMFTGKDDYEAQGKRMISKMSSTEGLVESNARGYGRDAAYEDISVRINEVERLIGII